MKQAVYVGATNLHNVAGRIEYISSEEKQENLYATYETAPREFWQELRTVNQEEFRRFGTNGKCIEARELIISLPKGFTRYDSEDMLKYFTDAFKEKYGVECISALHHNKRKTNLHIHLIFAERKKLLEPEVKVATRAMYFDNKGNRIRTKKEAMNDKGKLKRGYKMVPKGAVYEENTFTPKIKHFKDKGFLDEVKQFYVDIMNEKLDDRNKICNIYWNARTTQNPLRDTYLSFWISAYYPDSPFEEGYKIREDVCGVSFLRNDPDFKYMFTNVAWYY